MNTRPFSKYVVAGSIALAAPLIAFAQPAGHGPDSRPGYGQQPMMQGAGAAGAMHGMRGMHHGDGHGRMHGMRGMHHGEGYGIGLGMRLLRGLDLSEEQRDRIFEILHAQAPQVRAKGKELRQARQELQRLALSTEFDEARVKAASDRTARAIADIAQLRTAAANQVYRLLTPEQQQTVQQR
ncbi:MAG TPA: Spy/CpxP family protein refolding chaperone, partial [Burkholderiaceae bacterium]|nr:Spy/CpxP family protein refolding chaperone [Burkholderiaceae bacterium]